MGKKKLLRIVTQDDARQLWSEDPLGVFEFFRNCAITLVESVAGIHHEAKAVADPSEPLSKIVDDWRTLVFPNLESARAIWWVTPINNCLTQPQPILVDRLRKRRTRFDGACYHEVAINFADDALLLADSGVTCRDYAAHLRSSTARGDLVTDYLKSLAADIRCECSDGMTRWHDGKPVEKTLTLAKPGTEKTLTGRPCRKRDQLWLEWHAEIGPEGANVIGKIRDRWNAMSDAERLAFNPCHAKIGIGKAGYDVVRKAISAARKDGGKH